MRAAPSMLSRVRSFLDQPDAREHPARALWRRLRWKAHWRLRGGTPIALREWWGGLEILLPRSGSAAQVFYRQFSDAAIVRALEHLLAPGMTVIDVGAHVGEYALAAARLVGPGGRVVAIEPQPDLCELIRASARRNGIRWLECHACALAASAGRAPFAYDPTSRGGWLAGRASPAVSFEVPLQTLSGFCETRGLAAVDLIKLDAAGNELAVLEGGASLLARERAPHLVVKFYHPDVVLERFGHPAEGLRRRLLDWGYALYEWRPEGPRPFAGKVAGYCTSVIATRAPLSPRPLD